MVDLGSPQVSSFLGVIVRIVDILCSIYFDMTCFCVGKYYLVDLDYTNTGIFIAPYQNERYLIAQYQGRGNITYRSLQDKFNHRHVRNVVERVFGVPKMRFTTLKKRIIYTFRAKILTIVTCCVIHNFICREHVEDSTFCML